MERGTPDLSLRPTVDSPERLQDAILMTVRSSGAEGIHMMGAAGQCLKFSHFFAPYLARATGLKAWPTLGQLWRGNRRMFGSEWPEMQTLMRRGLQLEDMTAEGRDGVQWHAWITLETGELVDMTFGSTLAHVFPHQFADLAGTIAWGREPEVFNEHRFFPMLAGAPAIEALQAKSSVPFLASSVDGLATMARALVPAAE
jgi:hypothetical protein